MMNGRDRWWQILSDKLQVQMQPVPKTPKLKSYTHTLPSFRLPKKQVQQPLTSRTAFSTPAATAQPVRGY